MNPSNIVSSRISLLALLGVASAALAACDANPIGGGSGGGGGDDATSVVSTSTNSAVGGGQAQGGSDAQGGGEAQGGSDAQGGGSSTGGAPAQYDSIALYGDELPDVGAGGGTSSSGVGGSGPDDDADRLYLFIADSPTSCADPYAVDESCPVDTFRATIGLPPAYQQPGTYDLDDPAISASFGEWGSNGDGTCWGGGGSFLDGTIEVLSVDSERVRVILAGTSPSTLDGQHTVMLCGGEAPSDGNVIGYYPSELPPPPEGESSSVTTGGGEEEKFILVFADHGQSCADPFGDQPGPGEVHHDFVVRLPPSYLVPGTYDLADPAIETDQFQYEEDTAATGADGTNVGTLTIHEVGADFIDLELRGTQFDFANVATVVPRCTGG